MQLFIAGATPWIEVACCVAREVQARLLCHHEHRLFEFGCGRLSPTGTNVRCKEGKDASHSNASRPEYVSAELLTRVTEP